MTVNDGFTVVIACIAVFALLLSLHNIGSGLAPTHFPPRNRSVFGIGVVIFGVGFFVATAHVLGFYVRPILGDTSMAFLTASLFLMCGAGFMLLAKRG